MRPFLLPVRLHVWAKNSSNNGAQDTVAYTRLSCFRGL